MVEVKGANIRRALREGTRRSRRHILGFLSEVVSLLESHDARISARVYVKVPSIEFMGTSVYSAAIQRLAQTFEDKLMRDNDKGVIVLDSRNKVKNVPVAHSLFTWNLSTHGTAYRYMAELPRCNTNLKSWNWQLKGTSYGAFLFKPVWFVFYFAVFSA